MLGEQRATTNARNERLKASFPVIFGTNDVKTGIEVDGYTASTGGAPSDFGMTAMRIAAAAGNERPKTEPVTEKHEDAPTFSSGGY